MLRRWCFHGPEMAQLAPCNAPPPLQVLLFASYMSILMLPCGQSIRAGPVQVWSVQLTSQSHTGPAAPGGSKCSCLNLPQTLNGVTTQSQSAPQDRPFPIISMTCSIIYPGNSAQLQSVVNTTTQRFLTAS